jgi:hypothetical protein
MPCMSADFVPKDTIDALVTAALTWDSVQPREFVSRPLRTRMVRTVTWEDATAVGGRPWRQNRNMTEGWIDPSVDMPEYVVQRYAGEPDPVVILETIRYHRYPTDDEPRNPRAVRPPALCTTPASSQLPNCPVTTTRRWASSTEEPFAADRSAAGSPAASPASHDGAAQGHVMPSPDRSGCPSGGDRGVGPFTA